MVRNLRLTVVVVLSLGVAIGANTGIFSVINAVLLHPIPVHEPDRLVRVRVNLAPVDEEPRYSNLSPAVYFQWREHQEVFEDFVIADFNNIILTGAGNPEYLRGLQVNWNFFRVFGINPAMGRAFTEEEDQPGKNNVAVISHGLWTSSFGSDPDIIGRTVQVNGVPHDIIGVAPPRFHYPWHVEMWRPAGLTFDPTQPHRYDFNMTARLKEGITVEEALREMNSLTQRISEQYPQQNNPTGVRLTPLREQLLGDTTQLLYLVQAAAAFVLLIACVNIINLMLAQTLQQSGEIAMRTALGAGRGRLASQLIVQTVMLALLGGLLAVPFSLFATRPLLSISPLSTEDIQDFDPFISVDLRLLGFAILLSILVGILLGLIPALKASRLDIQRVLQGSGSRGAGLGAAGQRFLGFLVVAEVAIALMLMIGASLVIQSLQRLQQSDRGFDYHNLIVFDINFPRTQYEGQRQRLDFIKQAQERIRALPGVTAAAATTTHPLYDGQNYLPFSLEGHPIPDPPGYYYVHHRVVTPGYFETLEIPLLQGKLYDGSEVPGTELQAIVNKTMADRYWPGENPIGKRLKIGRLDQRAPWVNVVAVVGDVYETPSIQAPVDVTWYMAAYQGVQTPSISFVIRTTESQDRIIPPIRAVINELDPQLPIYAVANMDQLVSDTMSSQRFSAFLYGFFGLTGVLLAMVGIYGVMSFSVAQRNKELGIRLAIGAQVGDVKGLILRRAALLTLIGVAFGLALAALFTQFLSSLLYEVDPLDPLTYLLVALGLAVIALLGSYLPARRVTRIDPTAVLQSQ